MHKLLRDFSFTVVTACVLIACTGGTCTLFEKKCDSHLTVPAIGACPNNFDNFGGYGQPCNDPGTCNGGGLACVEGTCLPCGGADQACCTQTEGGPGTCNGTTCAYNGYLDWYQCEACGNALGASCCEDNLCSVGMCDTNTEKCIAATSTGGSTTYWVWVVDPECGAQVHGFVADSQADAQTAAQTWFTSSFPQNAGYYLGAVSTGEYAAEPMTYQVCPTACSVLGGLMETTNTLYAFNPSEITACESQLDDTCTWLASACPGD